MGLKHLIADSPMVFSAASSKDSMVWLLTRFMWASVWAQRLKREFPALPTHTELTGGAPHPSCRLLTHVWERGLCSPCSAESRSPPPVVRYPFISQSAPNWIILMLLLICKLTFFSQKCLCVDITPFLCVCFSITDTGAERQALRENVYPKLREFCRENYGLEFQVIDINFIFNYSSWITFVLAYCHNFSVIKTHFKLWTFLFL